MFTHHVHQVVRYLICLIHSFKGFYGRFKYSKDIADSLKSIFTNINTERISEILVGVVLCFIGFVLARIISNTFIRTVGSRFNAHQRLVWRRGIFYFIFLLFIMTSLKEAGFKLSVFLGAAGILTVALGFASQTSASNLISGLFLIGEGSFEVGDTIQITLIRGNTIEGEVISIDLLSVKLLYTRQRLYSFTKRTTHSCSRTQLIKISNTAYSNYFGN